MALMVLVHFKKIISFNYFNYITFPFPGAEEQQFFNCRSASSVFSVYGTKSNGILKSFGVSCSGVNGGRWRVLGPASLPSAYHYS